MWHKADLLETKCSSLLSLSLSLVDSGKEQTHIAINRFFHVEPQAQKYLSKLLKVLKYFKILYFLPVKYYYKNIICYVCTASLLLLLQGIFRHKLIQIRVCSYPDNINSTYFNEHLLFHLLYNKYSICVAIQRRS